jgi:[ribosomal protein S5]-alanine N-acetyltransferase
MNPVKTVTRSLELFFDPPALETPRLTLRKMTGDDADAMFEYAKDPDVSKYTVWEAHTSINKTRGFLNYILENYKNGIIEDWGIVHREKAKLIGTCGFFDWDCKNNGAHIHYALSKKYSGNGLMTEAIKAVIAFGFDKMKLKRIEARCMVENIASERVMQKSGMKFEGIARASLFVKGAYRDMKIYAILREDLQKAESLW